MTLQISYNCIFQKWKEVPTSDAIIGFVLEKIGSPMLTSDALCSLKTTLRVLVCKIQKKWRESSRNLASFLNKNASWLENNVKFSNAVRAALPSGLSRNAGRPKKEFKNCHPKVKNRKVRHILKSSSQDELAKATATKLYQSGKRNSAAIVMELASASPERGSKIKKARISSSNSPPKLAPDQALALLIDANLSSNQYNIVRDQAKNHSCTLYPPYYVVKEAKRLCYPKDIIITEVSAEVSVQSLINHTVARLCVGLEGILRTLSNVKTLNIIVKWGCDGAEQVNYRQKYMDKHSSDDSMFSVSMVPIQMGYVNDNGENHSVIWKNPAPSSTRYCRPIKFVFAKETVSVITSEVNKVKEQISELTPTTILVDGKQFQVTANMIFCMIDGKVCNAVSSCASSQTCYLCGAKPSEMNNICDIPQKNINESFLSLGISPLHAWIRFLECVLHISYKLDIKTWQARGAENKKKVAEKKKYIQQKFKEELGLLIDMPKQQTGNTNDGNTARKFFRNAQKSAEITGFNLDLIKRFHVLLESLNCGLKIDSEKFGEYARETLELYLKEYFWYSMPVSVHKVLCHGKDIIASCILPIGQLSEEAQEARNKDCRKYRDLFTRKTSRIDTNTDLFNRLLISSDPYIASLRKAPKTKHSEVTPEVLELLETFADPCNDYESSDDCNESSSE